MADSSVRQHPAGGFQLGRRLAAVRAVHTVNIGSRSIAKRSVSTGHCGIDQGGHDRRGDRAERGKTIYDYLGIRENVEQPAFWSSGLSSRRLMACAPACRWGGRRMPPGAIAVGNHRRQQLAADDMIDEVSGRGRAVAPRLLVSTPRRSLGRWPPTCQSMSSSLWAPTTTRRGWRRSGRHAGARPPHGRCPSVRRRIDQMVDAESGRRTRAARLGGRSGTCHIPTTQTCVDPSIATGRQGGPGR